jgi:hypothetical protein
MVPPAERPSSNEATTGANPTVPPIEPVADDWPVQATDTIVNLVDQVRDKTTGPILTAARAAVFGLMVAIMVAIAAVLGLILVVRVLTELMPVWAAYLLLGSLFVIAGAIVFRKRHIPPVI